MLDRRYNLHHTQKKLVRDWLIVLAVIVSLVYLFTPPTIPKSPLASTPVVYAVEPSPEPIVEAPKIKKTVVPPNPHQGAVDQYANQYGVSPELMNCILFKESSFNPSAKNKNSSATGMAQFIKSTWTSFRTRMGEDTNLDLRLDARESIKTLAWALSKGYKNHWLVVTNGSCK